MSIDYPSILAGSYQPMSIHYLSIYHRLPISIYLFIYSIQLINIFSICNRDCLRGVMANELDCVNIVSEFELQTPYHVIFQNNDPEENIKTPTTSSGLNSPTNVILLGCKKPRLIRYWKNIGWYAI